MKILEEIWFGNINPQGQDSQKDPRIKDYTLLLSELQGQTPSSPAEVAVATPEEEREPYSPHRQRIMSDEKVKYFYSRNGEMLHDKSCPQVRDIPDEELCCAEGYPTNISQCPHCAMKAYVLSAWAREISTTFPSMRSTLSGCGSLSDSSGGCM